ncbi:MAG TPA: S9 family peptidase [Acidobacteriaceae bacterium]|jgi:dipeptidyl aminopeptidase/acylaminoacyl peptidase
MNSRTFAAAVFGFSLTISYAWAQAPAKRPMTFADLQAMKRVSDPQISPSGKWVLFSVTDVSLEKNSKTNHFWAVPLDGSAPEHQVTFGDGESNGRFSPDGEMVALNMKDQIYKAAWDDAKGRLGESAQVTNVDGGADGAIWSPDSKRLLFVSSVYPECSDLGDWAREEACDKEKNAAAEKSPVKAMVVDHLLYRHWNAFTGDKRSHVLVVDADGHHVRDLTPRSVVGDAETPTFSLGGPLGYAWSPDSHEIAYVTNLEKVKAESTNNDVFTLQLDEPGAMAKKVSTSPGSDDGPLYSPDGKWLAWRSQARDGYESDKFDLVVMDRANGVIRNLTSKFDGWVDEFVWWQGSNGFTFASAKRGGERIYNEALKEMEPTMLSVQGEYSDLRLFTPPALATSSLLPDTRPRMIAVRMTAESPASIVSVAVGDTRNQTADSEDWHTTSSAVRTTGTHTGRVISTSGNSHFEQGSWTKDLTHLNDGVLSSIEMPAMVSFWFTGAANARVQGFLIRPPNFDSAKKYPVKFLMHGGPQGAWGDAWSYRWNPELFAADGYVVVMVNPRGSTGYGQKFLEEVSGDWGGRAFDDLMKGLDYAEQQYPFIDKNRECALGASYGGFMANWVLTHTNRFKCIVTHDGMYNPQAAFGDTEELWFNEWEFRPLAANGVVEQGKPAHPWDFYDKPASEDPFRKWSPMLAIKNAHTPTLVVHSQRDYRLDVSEGFQLFTALQLLHVPSKMLYFPDEGHWVLKPKNSELWYQTVNDWCDRWLGMNKYASVGPERNPAARQRTEIREQRSGAVPAVRASKTSTGTQAKEKSDK